MIFTWLWIAIKFLLRLLIPAPGNPPEVKIDPNGPCPACGHRKGSIRFVLDKAGQKGMRVRHTCGVCDATWDEDPVLKVIVAMTQPKE